MKSHSSGMGWVMAIMAVRANFLPTEIFVHEADTVPHSTFWPPDSEKLESVCEGFDDSLCQRWASCCVGSPINSKVYRPILAG